MLYKESILEFMDRLSVGEYPDREWTTYWLRQYVGINGREIYGLQKHNIIPRPRHKGRRCVWSGEEMRVMLTSVLDFIARYDLGSCFTTKYGWVMKNRGKVAKLDGVSVVKD